MNEAGLWYHPVLEALGYAIFHSLWQGVLLFFPLQLVLLFCKKAAIRYRMLYGGFSLLFVLFVATFLAEWNTAAQLQQAMAVTAPNGGHETVNAGYNVLANVPHSWWQSIVGFYHTPAFRNMLPAISTCYTLGILLLALRMVLGFRKLRTIRKEVMAVPDGLQQRFLALLKLISIKRKVSLYFSEHVHVPLMMGHLKPIVILPVALINNLDWQQTEAILLHELAHVKRMDYLFNILQSVMEIFLFFNPIVWWFSGIIRKEREHCCDDMTVLHTEQPVKYAEALLQLELSKKWLKPALAAAGNHKKHTLLNRIKRIVEMNHTSKRSPQSIFATLTFLMIFVALFGYYVSVAQGNRKDDPKKQTQQTTTTTTIVSDSYDTEDHAEAAIPEPPVPPDMDTVVSSALDAANVALANINWDEIDGAMAQAGDEISKINWEDINRDFADAQKDLDAAQKELDGLNMPELNNALSIAQNALDGINWTDIGNSVATGLQSLDKTTRDKVMKDVRNAMETARMQAADARRQVEDVRRQSADVKQQAADVKMRSADAKRQAADARMRAADARRQSADARMQAADARRQAADARRQAAKSGKTSDLLKKLQQDGLIDRNKNFSVSYKKQELVVNGKKVDAAPYRSYLPESDKATLRISGDKNNLSISQEE